MTEEEKYAPYTPNIGQRFEDEVATTWNQVEALATKCAKTWGFGFPVISLSLLRHYRANIKMLVANKNHKIDMLKAEIEDLKSVPF